MKAAVTIFLLLAGCIEAPPAAISNNSEPDMTEPDPQDMFDANNVGDMSRPDVGADVEFDIPIGDLEVDQSEPLDPLTISIELEAPGTSSAQEDIPLWVRIQNVDELLSYQNIEAQIAAGTPSELIYLYPNAKSMGFWVKWPTLTEQKSVLPIMIEPGQSDVDEALWSDFAHVWHMRSSPNMIPSSKGGIALTATPMQPGLNFLGPAFRGTAEALNVNVAEEFTIMFWFQYFEQDLESVRILSLNEGPAGAEFRLDLNQNYLKMYQSGLNHSHQNTPLPPNIFHHVVLTRNTAGVSIRVNGDLWGSNNATGSPQTDTFRVQVGQEGKNLAFAELWMAEGIIDPERLSLMYRNQLQAIQNAQRTFVVTKK